MVIGILQVGAERELRHDGFEVGRITGDWIRSGFEKPSRTSPRDSWSLGSTLVSPTRLADSAEFAESLVMQYSVMKELPREYAMKGGAQWGICFMTRGGKKAENPTPNTHTQRPSTQVHRRPARRDENMYLAAALRATGDPRVQELQIDDRTHGSITGDIAHPGDGDRSDLAFHRRSLKQCRASRRTLRRPLRLAYAFFSTMPTGQ
jgi:hypothetical protein